MNEKRKNERKKLIAFTPVYDSRQNILGYLGDLTVEGTRLIGEKPMEVNTKITLVIDFPATTELPARRVTVPARVIWCNQEENRQYFNTGFEFLDISQQNKAIIGAILERYQFRRPTRA